jgi:hypothetical protein
MPVIRTIPPLRGDRAAPTRQPARSMLETVKPPNVSDPFPGPCAPAFLIETAPATDATWPAGTSDPPGHGSAKNEARGPHERI